MEPDFYVPGDEQFQMVNQPLEGGIAPLLSTNSFMPTEIPDIPIKEIGKNLIKNKAKNYLAKKVGLEGIAKNVLDATLGAAIPLNMASGIAPLALLSGMGNPIGALQSFSNRLQSSDFGRSTSLADYLDMRKYGGADERDMARRINMDEAKQIQQRIDQKQAAGGYDTSQDRGRGQNIPSAPKAPAKTSSTYSAAQRDRKR